MRLGWVELLSDRTLSGWAIASDYFLMTLHLSMYLNDSIGIMCLVRDLSQLGQLPFAFHYCPNDRMVGEVGVV